MSATLVEEDDDVPDTLSDPRPALPGGAPKRPSRRPVIVASVVGVVLVLASLALGLWLFVLRYDATAKRHLPGNAHIAVRAEFSKILLFGPVREHLWPLVTGESNAPQAPGPTRIEKIKDATGVDLARDPRELVVASTDGSSWIAILGGRLERGRFVTGLAKVAKEEAWPGFRLDGDMLVGPHGVAIAQADDGTLLLGSTASIVTAALTPSDEYKRLELADDAALTFAIAREAWSGASGALGLVLAHASSLGRVERATGKMTLGGSPEVSLRVVPRAGQPPSEIAKELDATLGDLRLVSLILPDFGGEKAALAGAKVTVAPDGQTVLVAAPWPHDGLDRGCSRVAALIRAAR